MGDASISHRMIQTSSIRLHITQAGPKSGPVLIFLHGFPEFWYSWRHQISYFANRGYRVIVPDQRGYHLSDKPAAVSDYRIPVLAQDVLEILQAEGIDQAEMLVGHDWGGALSWYLAEHHGTHFKRVAILNVPHPLTMRREILTSWSQLKKSWYILLFQLPGIPERLLMKDECFALTTMMQKTAPKHTFSKADLQKYVEAWQQPHAIKSMLNWYRAAIRYPPQMRQQRITIPLLLIWGMKDHALNSIMAAPSLLTCENSRLVEIPEASHWVQNDSPDEVNGALTAFLQE